MQILTFVLILTALCIPLGLPLFETAFGIMLLAPIFAHLLGLWLGAGPATYVLVLALLLGLLWALRWKEVQNFKYKFENFVPILVFLCTCILVYSLCLEWPDFISIGERLRDYAVLSSAISYPLEAREPWMTGYNLNYYLYWYRFGSMLAALFKLPAWELYHQLQSFTFALYLTAIFRLFSAYLKFKPWNALWTALIIVFGSNVAGIVFAFSADTNWWGPSRVVEGAIDEFPAWSFVLGDVHPHYLNLGLVPFLITLILALLESKPPSWTTKAITATVMIVAPFWVYNANAWEVPVVLGIFMVLLAGLGLAWVFWRNVSAGPEKGQSLPQTAGSYRESVFTLTAAALACILLCVSLYLSSRNLSSEDKFTLVKDPIPRTVLWQFLKHWGFPVFLIASSSLVLLRSHWERVSAFILIVAALFCPKALALLFVLLIITVYRAVLSVRHAAYSGTLTLPEIVLEAISISVLGLVLVPEFVFLNDSYGPEIERMNTIFKAYSAAWYLMHTAAFYLAAKALARFSWPDLKPLALPGQLLLMGVMLSCFFKTAGLRTSKFTDIAPRAHGLSEVNNRFPGSADIIKKLISLPRGTVLEAQGKPYDMTSFVSTLSGNEAFLGWANHVNLLVRKGDEVGRRERTSDQFYNSKDCAEKRGILEREKISYAVVGSLEAQRHGPQDAANYSCLTLMAQAGDYRIYSK